jgi:hypothetical protein
VQQNSTTSGSVIATRSQARLPSVSMPRSSSGVPSRPPAIRAVCTDTLSGASDHISVSIVVFIDGTSSPIRARQPYMRSLLKNKFNWILHNKRRYDIAMNAFAR